MVKQSTTALLGFNTYLVLSNFCYNLNEIYVWLLEILTINQIRWTNFNSFFFSQDSNIGIPDVEGKTPLHWAASSRDSEAVNCVKTILVSTK